MILLDTHVLLWWLAGGSRLSKPAAESIAGSETVLISPVSFWEIATLVLKGYVTLDRDIHAWTLDVLADDRVETAALTPPAAVAAASLGDEGFHGDPADRFLCATARELSVPFVTKDTRIREFARKTKDLRVVW